MLWELSGTGEARQQRALRLIATTAEPAEASTTIRQTRHVLDRFLRPHLCQLVVGDAVRPGFMDVSFIGRSSGWLPVELSSRLVRAEGGRRRRTVAQIDRRDVL